MKDKSRPRLADPSFQDALSNMNKVLDKHLKKPIKTYSSHTFNVLYLDSNSSELNSFRRKFKSDYHVLTTRHRDQALQMMEIQKVHIILVSENLLHGSGIDFLEKVKEQFPTTIRILVADKSTEELKKATTKAAIFGLIDRSIGLESIGSNIKAACQSLSGSKTRMVG